MTFIPVVPEPILPLEPKAPDVASQYPKPLVLTLDEAKDYLDACGDYELGERADSAIFMEFGLTESAACNWAIYGQTVQGNLTVEGITSQIATHEQLMRSYTTALRKIIADQYKLSQRAEEAVKEVVTPPKPRKKIFGLF